MASSPDSDGDDGGAMSDDDNGSLQLDDTFASQHEASAVIRPMLDEVDGVLREDHNGAADDQGEDAPHVLREQDRFLPIANISRIMKRVLPDSGKVAKEAKECCQECVSEFISFITSEASERCQNEKRKTINGEDILWAMQTLGFDNYVEPLKLYLAQYREAMRGDRVEGSEEATQPISIVVPSRSGPLTTANSPGQRGVTLTLGPGSQQGLVLQQAGASSQQGSQSGTMLYSLENIDAATLSALTAQGSQTIYTLQGNQLVPISVSGASMLNVGQGAAKKG